MTGNAKFGSRLLKNQLNKFHAEIFRKGFWPRGVPGMACRAVPDCEDPHSHTITRHRRCHKLDAYLIWIAARSVRCGVSGWRPLAENQLSGNFYHLGVVSPASQNLALVVNSPTPIHEFRISNPFAYLLTNGSDTFTLFRRKIPQSRDWNCRWHWDWD